MCEFTRETVSKSTRTQTQTEMTHTGPLPDCCDIPRRRRREEEEEEGGEEEEEDEEGEGLDSICA